MARHRSATGPTVEWAAGAISRAGGRPLSEAGCEARNLPPQPWHTSRSTPLEPSGLGSRSVAQSGHCRPCAIPAAVWPINRLHAPDDPGPVGDFLKRPSRASVYPRYSSENRPDLAKSLIGSDLQTDLGLETSEKDRRVDSWEA